MLIKKCLTLHHILDIISLFAGMAELADALDLGSSGRPCRFKSCCPYYLKIILKLPCMICLYRICYLLSEHVSFHPFVLQVLLRLKVQDHLMSHSLPRQLYKTAQTPVKYRYFPDHQLCLKQLYLQPYFLCPSQHFSQNLLYITLFIYHFYHGQVRFLSHFGILF